MKKRKLRALALLLPAAFLLTACGDVTVDMKVSGNGNLSYNFLFVDTNGVLGVSNDCETIEGYMPSYQNVSWKETEKNGTRACQATIDLTDEEMAEFVTETDTSYTLVVDGSGDYNSFTLNVEMPGQIVEYTEGGKVNGNSISYKDANLSSNQYVISGLKSGKLDGDPIVLKDSEESKVVSGDFVPKVKSGSSEKSGSSKLWLWILIGVVAVLAILAVIFFVVFAKKRKTKKDQEAAGYQVDPNAQFSQGYPMDSGYSAEPAYPENSSYLAEPGYPAPLNYPVTPEYPSDPQPLMDLGSQLNTDAQADTGNQPPQYPSKN